jgi:hypothetical protein
MKSRIIKNVHGSAAAALGKWLYDKVSNPKASLWCADPIRLGPDKFQAYGCWRFRRLVGVEFLTDKIIVVNLPCMYEKKS